ncbi:MAG: hypothetical protein OEY33_09295 [Bdellovibrionales bacterium]|nr:hypothetical protein [Bdellovibrionales bacterium]
MSTRFKIISYEIKESKTGEKIPVVNGIHLHSIYNPVKEAENFIEENSNLLKENSNILVLGLGFGYHIKELIERLKDFHGDSFQVFIIEPIDQLVNDSKELLDSFKNTNIITNLTVEELYSDREFINFLVTKPALLAHPSSFNLSKSYFTGLLKYKSDNSIDKSRYLLKNHLLKNIFSTYPQNISLDKLVETKCRNDKPIEGEIDYIFQIYKELSKQTGPKEELR